MLPPCKPSEYSGAYSLPERADQREISYRILMGAEGARLRAIATVGDQSQRTAKAIAWLRTNYSKQIKVEELTDGLDAASAAYEVGYESASQFSREYSRLFGQPPLRDIRMLRAPGALRMKSVSAG